MKEKDRFLTSSKLDKPIIFEIFIDEYHDEEKAWEMLTTTYEDKDMIRKQKIKSGVESIIGESGVKIAKKILRNVPPILRTE